ncbi:MAG: MBL fold metallo-hydrolase [Egibacteraceae bacterium]
MEIVELRPNLHMLLLRFGQAYLWRDRDSLTLIDTGIAGSGADIAQAITGLGLRTGDLRRVVLTHFHNDHAGSAAEVRGWGEVAVLAHRRDAPVIRGDTPGPPPVLTDAEQPLYERVASGLPPAPPAVVDQELEDGQVIDFGGGARVIASPGHTAGSIALYLPQAGVLFAGDIAAHVDGQLILGPFNVDRAQARRSFRRLTQQDADVVCFGHGDPIVDSRASPWRAAAAQLSVPDPLA